MGRDPEVTLVYRHGVVSVPIPGCPYRCVTDVGSSVLDTGVDPDLYEHVPVLHWNGV